MAQIDIQLAELVIDHLGDEGPVTLHTNMCSHNYDLDEAEELEIDETVILGRAGVRITKEDIQTFLKKLKAYVEDPRFNNGRSYYFEGIERDEFNPKAYEICWGS